MLHSKIVVVTGASRGIGRAISLEMAKQGAKVVINYRSDDLGANETLAIIESFGGTAVLKKGDVSKLSDSKELVDFAIESYGTIDILVNNAGITKDSLILRMKEEDFDSVINVNLKGSFNCIKNVVPIMIKNKSGKIINISSVVGVVGNAGQVNYSASKAGIIGMTKSLAKEVGSRGINVNCIAPGFITTDMTETLSNDVKKSLMSLIPLSKFGNAEDVANLAVFLASDRSSYITGQTININGGMAM